MSLITEQQKDQFHELGYFLTDVVIEKNLLEAMALEMERVYQEKVAEARRTGNAEKVRAALEARSHSPFHTMSAVGAEFVKHPIYLDLCRAFIGPDADLYYNQITTKYPELGKIFGWHQDSGYSTTIPLAYITCWTAITDATVDNGTIWVIPGSHKWGVLPHESVADTPEKWGGKEAVFSDESGAIPVEVKAGQVACFSSLTLHRSGPNTTNTLRRGFVPQYHVPGVVLTETGKPWGDQWPVLRNNQRHDVPVFSRLLTPA